jgi:hypothetical protein
MEYIEDCCFNAIRDNCVGEGCNCGCHAPKIQLHTRQQRLLSLQRDAVNSDVRRLIDILLEDEVKQWPYRK